MVGFFQEGRKENATSMEQVSVSTVNIALHVAWVMRTERANSLT